MSDDTDYQETPKSLLESKFERVTRVSCPVCGVEFQSRYKRPYGYKKFCSNSCRWTYHNKQRLQAITRQKTAASALKTMAIAAIEFADSILEVKKKGE